MLVSPVLLNAAENLINRLLRLDPDVKSYLNPLAGKIIAINIKQPDWTVYCCPYDGGLQLLGQYDGDPDTRLTGSLSAFATMFFSDSPLSVTSKGDVVIEGDLDTVRQFRALFSQIELDPEEWLSHFTGDVIAHRAGNIVRSGTQWSREIGKTLELDVTEYFQHESRELPAQSEARHFFQEVDKLRSDYDRLEARIRRLQTSLEDST